MSNRYYHVWISQVDENNNPIHTPDCWEQVNSHSQARTRIKELIGRDGYHACRYGILKVVEVGEHSTPPVKFNKV